MANTMTETLDLSTLREDGDTLELDDGRVLRLRVVPDDCTTFSDFDCYGRLECDGPRNWQGYPTRPKDFTGNAERLYYGNDGPWWWEPPADGPKRGTPEFSKFRTAVAQLAAYGFVVLVLELCEGHDYYVRPIVVGSASLGGIEWDSDPADYLPDMVYELGL